MSSVFSRFAGVDLPVAVRGEGAYVIDRDGRRYLDASGGAGISCLGHSEPAVIRAIQEQAARLAFAYTFFYTTEAAEELAADLVADAPAGLTRVVFGSGGSEQMDGTIKLARQYCVDRGEPGRVRFIARRQSYHGNSLGSLSLGGHVKRREIYEPLLAKVEHIAPCYEYRGRLAGETAEAYGLRVANELEAALERVGPETVIAFVAETVVGATAGAVPAAPGYFRRIREICDRYGVLLILDEVFCGLGRTGLRYACEREGVAPDLMVLAKGLAAGYQPISATLVAGKIYETIAEKRGMFQHGHSYQAHATACAAAVAVQKVIREQELLENVRRQGAALMAALRERFAEHPHVGDIRGHGLMLALELVRDRQTKEPFAPEAGLFRKIIFTGMEEGIMCYPGTGTIDGVRGDHVLLAPPFNITGAQVGDIVEKLGRTLERVLR